MIDEKYEDQTHGEGMPDPEEEPGDDICPNCESDDTDYQCAELAGAECCFNICHGCGEQWNEA